MAQRVLTGVKMVWYMGIPAQNIITMRFEILSNAPNDIVMEDLMFNGTDGGWAGNARDIAVNTVGNLISAVAVQINNKENDAGIKIFALQCNTIYPTPAIEYTRSQPFPKMVAQETTVTLYVEDLIP